jgi:hypothetical protein
MKLAVLLAVLLAEMTAPLWDLMKGGTLAVE